MRDLLPKRKNKSKAGIILCPSLPMAVHMNTPIDSFREKDKDLQDMLGIGHPLHRRRVCLGIQKIKDKEEEEVSNKAGLAVVRTCSLPPGCRRDAADLYYRLGG